MAVPAAARVRAGIRTIEAADVVLDVADEKVPAKRRGLFCALHITRIFTQGVLHGIETHKSDVSNREYKLVELELFA